MQEQIDNINKQLSKLEVNQIKQGNDITIIKDAITGNELNPDGVIKRVEKLETFASKAKKHGYIGAGIIIAFSALKAGWNSIIDWISHIG